MYRFGQRFDYFQDLLYTLISREMQLLYKRSALGIAWTLLNPLLQLAVFVFVFQLILPIDMPHYTSFVFTGLLVWTWFQNSLFQATGVIIDSAALIRQPGFPITVLPVVITATGLVHFVLALPVLIVFLMLDGVHLTPYVMFLPVLQLLQMVFTVGLAYLLAALNVSFRDVQHTLGVVLQLLFYVTPIFYNISNVPSRYKILYELNPLVHIVTGYRAILLDGASPNWHSLLLLGLFTAVTLPFGYKIFKRQSFRFVEEL
ncbi:ABC transporter permease [Pseudanabaena sp. FACHB-2040]|uniref:ABC transporter permease n=1 Tax=Pseudanabaena sp. FACHB-2040 TaxID=2692859 RepID=UPI001684EFC1|nr:ABC transporter permease [Pseudanabaena sp. FACHB-2040]MBD2256339.1 ABC transporter permease [Pseudanabaena sp. FACHB-2040]